ncbi:MAG: hypothetical protein QGH73_04970 [Rhodospirillales bacterium]|jgi:hypothetical protein|nr:hypothetical protein [Rhodospirillales bacterium]MDP6841008.1 hypothetical protein [Rhodospirillales bacterium]|tara:strand:+ start:1207 stop:1434 length:228 start_codon:yes stop_codon:yes gene_type:complete
MVKCARQIGIPAWTRRSQNPWNSASIPLAGKALVDQPVADVLDRLARFFGIFQHATAFRAPCPDKNLDAQILATV